MPDDVYTKYTMRSEHALFVDLKDGIGFSSNHCNTSNLPIEDKLWYIVKLFSFWGLLIQIMCILKLLVKIT
jgi:hypothetical protein